MSIESDIRKMLGESKTSKPAEVIEPVELTDDEIVEGILALDELSKKTLGSYVKLASKSANTYGNIEGSQPNDRVEVKKHYKDAGVKRLKGIAKATDRLTKEQKETIEAVLEELEEDEEIINESPKHWSQEVGHNEHRVLTKGKTVATYTGKDAAKKASDHVLRLKNNVSEEITVDVSEDVNALLNGEDLTEEFKTKAATIFESAVVTRVKEEVSRLEESYETKLQEEVESIKEGLAEKVDGYLNYIVEQWITDNEIALTHGIKNEIMENFISGIKGVFKENYIDVPEEKFDVLGELEAKYSELEAKLNETVEKNVELHGQVNEMKRMSTVLEATDGLSDVQAEKFVTLAEELSYEDEATFIEKLKVIRENYFTKKAPARITETFITDEPINEEVQTVKLDPAMSAYVKVLNKK